MSLEGYGLFLLRADALEKDQATLLEPSSLILPLGLSLEVLLFFFIIIAFSSQGVGAVLISLVANVQPHC
jgi:hypothetical protein